MIVKQISVQLENTPGMLSRISEILGKEGINIGGITIVDSADASTIRLVTDNPEKTLLTMKNAKYHVWESEVIAVVTPDHPGGLSAVLKPIGDAGINIHYVYPYLRRYGDNAILVFRVSDTKRTVEILKENWITMLGDILYSL